MTLLLPWVPSCSRAEWMSSRYPGDRHDIHHRWDPSGGHFHWTKRRPLTSARVVVTAWLTSMCGRPSVLWSLQGRQVRGTAPYDSDYLQTAMLKVQHCPECFVIQLFPSHTVLTNKRVLTMPPACLLPLSSATLARLSQIRTQSSWAQGCRSVLSGCQAARLFLCSGSKSRHSSLKKMSFGQRVPPTPRKK